MYILKFLHEHFSLKIKAKRMFVATCLAFSNVQNRPISTQEVTKNILYISDDDKLDIKSNPKTLKSVYDEY